MKSLCIKGYLLAAGLVMASVGTYIAIATTEYWAAIVTGNSMPSINMLSDLRGMGGVLLVCGVYALMGAFIKAWKRPALITATAIYLSFVVFRSLGAVLDGLPETAIIMAYLVEATLAVLGLMLIK